MGKTFRFDDELDYVTARSDKDARRANFRRLIEQDRRQNTPVDMNIWVQNTIDPDQWFQK